MFNNSDSNSNGELSFYNTIKDQIKIIFDIGCRTDSIFTNFPHEVHYFDPVSSFIDTIMVQKNLNNKSYFNKFGLSDNKGNFFYYPRYQSFFDRQISCHASDDQNKILLKLETAKDYIEKNNITSIDFIKIDTEGNELKVIKGFEDYISIVKIIQFEYGGTFLDNNTKLIEVIDYLKSKGFDDFSYLSPAGKTLITDFRDHYQYCNIVCYNKN